MSLICQNPDPEPSVSLQGRVLGGGHVQEPALTTAICLQLS